MLSLEECQRLSQEKYAFQNNYNVPGDMYALQHMGPGATTD